MSVTGSNPIAGFSAGPNYILRGAKLLNQAGIRPFVIIPLLINIVLFSGGIWLLSNQLHVWLEQLLPTYLEWLEWLVMPIFIVLVAFVVFYTFTLLANLIAAPFNSILAERIEQHLKGLPVAEFQGLKSVPSLIVRTFRSELSKLWYIVKWLIPLVMLTLISLFIPLLAPIAPFAWAVFGAWMMAVEYVDYPMGNHELYFKEELATLKQYRAQALGFGSVLSLMTTIPFLNFLAMPVGVAGATALWVNVLSQPHRQ
ncbi:sulfate transporter CysZ [Thiolinea disciformis]|uniref:sulfate transporter CysZ n=1 Tax=Thiolinea disciformis TaxID=125614 RepID=UPI00036B827D|nr:sulfate transporter CysZ [Thiolinea disciformis]